jgi:surface polysaccharide O-acyltransferase-like enzyme
MVPIMRERNVSIEALRIICCFLVVGIHIAPMYDLYINMNISKFEMICALLVQSLVRVGLPVFFIISGMFLLNKPVDNIKNFYHKRLVALLIPFIIFSFLHFFLVNKLISGLDIPISFSSYFDGLLVSTGISIHLWFVYAMAGIYIITPLLSFLFNGISQRHALQALFFIIFIKIYNVYLKGYIHGLDIPDINTWLAYFMIGGILPRIKKIGVAWACMLVIAGYIMTVAATYMQFNSGGSFFYAPFDAGLNMYVFASALAYMFYCLDIKPSAFCSRIIKLGSENSYGIYLIHLIIFMLIAKYIGLSWYVGSSTSYTLIMTLAVFLISFCLAFTLNKIIVNPLIKLSK